MATTVPGRKAPEHPSGLPPVPWPRPAIPGNTGPERGSQERVRQGAVEREGPGGGLFEPSLVMATNGEHQARRPPRDKENKTDRRGVLGGIPGGSGPQGQPVCLAWGSERSALLSAGRRQRRGVANGHPATHHIVSFVENHNRPLQVNAVRPAALHQERKVAGLEPRSTRQAGVGRPSPSSPSVTTAPPEPRAIPSIPPTRR